MPFPKCDCVCESEFVFTFQARMSTGNWKQKLAGELKGQTLLWDWCESRNRAGSTKSVCMGIQNMIKPDLGNEPLIVIITLFRLWRSSLNFNKMVLEEEESWEETSVTWQNVPCTSGTAALRYEDNWVNKKSVGLNCGTWQNSSRVPKNLLEKRIEFKYWILYGHLV